MAASSAFAVISPDNQNSRNAVVPPGKPWMKSVPLALHPAPPSALTGQRPKWRESPSPSSLGMNGGCSVPVTDDDIKIVRMYVCYGANNNLNGHVSLSINATNNSCDPTAALLVLYALPLATQTTSADDLAFSGRRGEGRAIVVSRHRERR